MLSNETIVVGIALAILVAALWYYSTKSDTPKSANATPLQSGSDSMFPEVPNAFSPNVPMVDVHGNPWDDPSVQRVGATQAAIVDGENDLTRFQTYMVNPDIMNQHYMSVQF